MIKPIIAALIVASAIAPSGPDPVAPVGFKVDTLAKGVYAFIRKEPAGYGMESNSLLIVGDRSAAVVDAQLTPSDTRAVIAAIKRLTSKRVRYVINTHCHDDHVTGNAAYRAAFPSVEFVASRAMAEEFNGVCAANRASFRKQGMGTVKFLHDVLNKGQSLIGGPLPDDEKAGHLSYARLIEGFVKESDSLPIAPTITFESQLSLDLGHRTVDVRWLGRGHSRGDIIAYLPAEHIVAAGDLVVWPVPFIGSTSYPGDFANTLDSMLALAPTTIVPGHGPLMRDTTYIHNVGRLLRSIKSQVAASVLRGENLAQTEKAVDLSEFRVLFAGGSKLRQGLFDNYVTSSAIPAEYQAVTHTDK